MDLAAVQDQLRGLCREVLTAAGAQARPCTPNPPSAFAPAANQLGYSQRTGPMALGGNGALMSFASFKVLPDMCNHSLVSSHIGARESSLESSQYHRRAALGGDGALLSCLSEAAARYVLKHCHEYVQKHCLELAHCPTNPSWEVQLHDWSLATPGRSNSLQMRRQALDFPQPKQGSS